MRQEVLAMEQVRGSDPAFVGPIPRRGSTYWTLGLLMEVKIWGQDTGGRLSVCEFLCPPGYATPLHLHHREDETWWVIEGRVRFRCGDQDFVAEPGACLYLPLGVPHGWRVIGSENARLLHVSVPAGAEEFHIEMGEPTTERTLPPPTPVDLGRAAEIGAKHGIELVGPPID